MAEKPEQRHLRPYVHAVTAFGHGYGFQARTSAHHKRKFSEAVERKGGSAAPLNVRFSKSSFLPVSVYMNPPVVHAGISAVFSDSDAAVLAITIRDSIYSVDFCVNHLKFDDLPPGIDAGTHVANHVVSELSKYECEHLSKFLSAGLPESLLARSPKLASRLWAELDIVPIALHIGEGYKQDTALVQGQSHWDAKSPDEQADSVARKSVMYFGPSREPLLQVGSRGVVQVDAAYHARLVTLDDYEGTVSAATWKSIMQYATDLRRRKVKIAFFSATPQGGGVALMRHALVRFSKVLDLDVKWYVPKPKPGVFRITKTNHNILQGVSQPDERITEEQKRSLTDWIHDNAKRYWLTRGGPLSSTSEGGADVIVVDDPQMNGLIPLAKAAAAKRPVIFRSHIQIRSDLVAKHGSPQSDAWEYMWGNVQKADIFISHPVKQFVPTTVPVSMTGYLPAATDWLDGLNKNLSAWDKSYYGHMYSTQCHDMMMTKLEYPLRDYIVQIARFDPSKGIPDVITSYAKFRRDYLMDRPVRETPQLLICGHGSIDDPDGSLVYDQTMELLEKSFPDLVGDVSVMRLGPSDQLLNTLLSESYVALQLSTREGFEIKVSEALHKGKPVIATRAGGIPLQVQHEKNGFLVDVGDTDAVAKYLYDLWTDKALYDAMSRYAIHSVSDEVNTVGNALSWYYLASELSKGEGLDPNGRWINDMAREHAGQPYRPAENRLPRDV